VQTEAVVQALQLAPQATKVLEAELKKKPEGAVEAARAAQVIPALPMVEAELQVTAVIEPAELKVQVA